VRITARDGTPLFHKDWGPSGGAPVVFLSSWAMNADMWQYQMVTLAARGLRCIAYDRRGHGRSGQPSAGYDVDTLSDDLLALMETLDLEGVTLVGHSMGAAEITRYLTRHGASRVARIALIAPTTPCLQKAADNPDGVPKAAFESVRAGWLRDFPKWIMDNARGFVTPETSGPMIDWLMSLMFQCSLRAAIECHVALTEADFRNELRAVAVPTLIVHGDRDLSAPLVLTGRKTAALVPHARLEVYEGAPHGLFITHAERIDADLLAFIGA
jgi:pimeloyl-ACP methyl ester carboxylesterase